MNYNPQQHHRRSIRMPGYDYTEPGAYFVTICTNGRTCLFDDPVLRRVVETYWRSIPRHAAQVALDVSVVMPNHVHGILILQDLAQSVGAKHCSPALSSIEGLAACGEPPATQETPGNASPLHASRAGSLGAIIGTFKAVTARRINSIRHTPGANVWQRNYYEHIIRNERALQRIREYISNNSLCWDLDVENPANVQSAGNKGATQYYTAIWNEE
jgi:REP element-mobilizing transposase RayT